MSGTITPSSHKSSQSGIASLLFSMVMMVVISLIVLAFAQLARRDQRETLDSQLSTQAYYAAESGVNDAVKAIPQILAAGGSADNNGCAPTGAYASLTPVLNATDNVRYSCFKVDTSVTSLTADLDTTASKVIHIQPTSSMTSLTITWQSATTNPVNSCPAKNVGVAGEFSPSSSWMCPYGLVRFDLVPTGAPSLTRNGLLNSTMAVYAVPTHNGGGANTVNFSAGLTRVPAECKNPVSANPTCTITINGVTASQYDMRVMSKYLNAPGLTITGTSVGAATTFVNGQAIIDVTGQAQDVRRRIQVRLPLNGSGGYADYAIGSQGSICKRFAIGNGFFQDDSDCPVDPTP